MEDGENSFIKSQDSQVEPTADMTTYLQDDNGEDGQDEEGLGGGLGGCMVDEADSDLVV